MTVKAYTHNTDIRVDYDIETPAVAAGQPKAADWLSRNMAGSADLAARFGRGVVLAGAVFVAAVVFSLGQLYEAMVAVDASVGSTASTLSAVGAGVAVVAAVAFAVFFRVSSQKANTNR